MFRHVAQKSLGKASALPRFFVQPDEKSYFAIRTPKLCGIAFIIELEGKQNSRVRVQERYEVLRSNYSENVYEYNAYLKDNIPSKDSPRFTNIDMILQTATPLIYNNLQAPAETFETGKLTYGNANPSSKDFNSLADFMAGDGFVEIKLPWQLLNFSDPSLMTIHDDYYEHYGIEYIEVSEIWAGLSSNGSEPRRAELKPFKLKKWENTVTYHERLKSSYYALQKYWRNQDEDRDISLCLSRCMSGDDRI